MSEPSKDDPPLDAQFFTDRIDQTRHEFEQQWIAGGRPRIEDFLHRVPSEHCTALARELLRVDLAYRHQHGESPQLTDYESRLARFSSVLMEFFDATLDYSPDTAELTQDLIQTRGSDAATVRAGAPSEAARIDVTEDGTQEWIPDDEDAATHAPAGTASPRGGDLARAFANARYQVKRKLGGGGQKTALLARDVELDRDVVISVLRLGEADEMSLVRMRSEARAMARLDDHPNIVGIHDIGEQNGLPYFVSQYVEGGSVADLLRQRDGAPLPIDEAARIGEQVCQALEYAHQHSIVHRDVKPDNVWVMPDGTAKLGDFGLAAPLDRSRLTGTGVTVGTAAYMPPEQALGADIGPQSDLYSLGITLYEMVTGGYPFQGDSFVAVISQHLNSDPVPPSWHNPQVGQSLNSLILHLLAKVMDDRPPSAAVVREVLLTLVEQADAAVPESERQRSVEQLASGVFVGRQQETDDLRVGLDETIVGRGRIFLLAGEPGSGKTRTAEEARTYARLRNMEVHSGGCFEGEGAPAFWPWVQIIRSYASTRDKTQLLTTIGPAAADIAQLDAEIRQQLPELPPLPQMEPEQARFRLFDGITSFLRNAVKDRAMLLILDDLQWADEASLKLLEFLGSEIRDASLALLGTYRNIELGRRHPLTRTLAALSGEPHCQRIELSGLSQADIGQMVLSTSAVRPPEALLAAVWEKTEGNPFFVTEIIRFLVSKGQLEQAARDFDSLEIPESIREVVGRRLDQLSEECTKTLTVASAIGREFAVEVVERVSKIDSDEVLDALDEAEAARLVTEAPGKDERYLFTHDLIRETLYGEIRRGRRRGLHAKIGEAFEQLYASDLARHLPQLAYHFLRAAKAGDAEKAIDYASRASQRSLELLAHEEAARFGEMALKALELSVPVDEQRYCGLELALGDARRKAGQLVPAIESFQHVRQLAKQLTRPQEFALATMGWFNSTWQIGDIGSEEAVRITEEALAALDEDDSTIRARMLSVSARALRYFGELDMATTRADLAVEMARRVGDPDLLADALHSSIELSWGPEIAQRRLALSMEHARATEQLGSCERKLESCVIRVMCHLELGQIEEARAAVKDLVELADEMRLPFFSFAAAAVETMRALLEGRFEDAPRLAKEAQKFGERVRPDDVGATYGIHMFTLCKEKGQLKQIALAVNQLAKEPSAAAKWRPALALIFAELEFREKAAEEFEKLAANRFADIPQDGLWSTSMCYLTEVCRFLGDTGRANILYQLMKPHAGLNVVAGGAVVCYGSAARYLGQLATIMRQWYDAEIHFEEALSMNSRLGARPYLAHTQHEYAEMLLARGGTDDRQRAFGLLADALTTARGLGMELLERQIGSLER